MNIQAPTDSLFQWLDYRKIFQIKPGDSLESLNTQLWGWICQLTPKLSDYQCILSLVINPKFNQNNGDQVFEVSLNSKNNQPEQILILSQNGMSNDINLIQRYPFEQNQDHRVIKQFAKEIGQDKQLMSNISENALYCPFVNCDEEIKGQNDLELHITIHTQDNNQIQQFSDSDENGIIRHASSAKNQIEQVQVNNQTNTHQPFQDQLVQNMDDNRHHSLNIDIQIQGNSSRFRCTYPDCGKSFSRKSRLKAHLHLHWGTQPYRCEFPGCSKAFSERPNLIIHMRIHTKEKPFSCRTCGKRFTTKGNMKDHERRHLKQKPYSCETCGQPFYRKNILNKHVQKCTHDQDYNDDQQYLYENQTVNDQITHIQPDNINIHMSGSGSLGMINNQNIINNSGLFTNSNIIPNNQQIQQSIQATTKNNQLPTLQNPINIFINTDQQKLLKNTDLLVGNGLNPQSQLKAATNMVDNESKLNMDSSLHQQKGFSTNQQSQPQSIKVQGNQVLSASSFIPQNLFLQPIQNPFQQVVSQISQPHSSLLQFGNQGNVLQTCQNYDSAQNGIQAASQAQTTNPQQLNDKQFIIYANHSSQAPLNQQQLLKPSQLLINSQGLGGLQNQRMLQYQYVPNFSQSSLTPQLTNSIINNAQGQSQLMFNQYQPLQNLPSQYGQPGLTYLNVNPFMNQLGQFLGSNNNINNSVGNQASVQPQIFQSVIQPNNINSNIASTQQQSLLIQPQNITTFPIMDNKQKLAPPQQGVTQNEVQANSSMQINYAAQ